MISGISVNGFAWPAIDVRPASTGMNAGVATSVAPQYGRDGHMDWGDGGWIVMVVMMSVFWLGVLAIAAWAVHTYSRRGERVRPDSPLDIARRRYASGEITQDEFEAIKRNLG
jgi:putative membrane protein